MMDSRSNPLDVWRRRENALDIFNKYKRSSTRDIFKFNHRNESIELFAENGAVEIIGNPSDIAAASLDIALQFLHHIPESTFVHISTCNSLENNIIQSQIDAKTSPLGQYASQGKLLLGSATSMSQLVALLNEVKGMKTKVLVLLESLSAILESNTGYEKSIDEPCKRLLDCFESLRDYPNISIVWVSLGQFRDSSKSRRWRSIFPKAIQYSTPKSDTHDTL